MAVPAMTAIGSSSHALHGRDARATLPWCHRHGLPDPSFTGRWWINRIRVIMRA